MPCLHPLTVRKVNEFQTKSICNYGINEFPPPMTSICPIHSIGEQWKSPCRLLLIKHQYVVTLFLIPSHLIIQPLGDNQKVFLDYSRSPGSREIASRCCSRHVRLVELLLSGWSEPCCTLNVCGIRRAFDPRREHFEVGQGMASLSFAYNLWVHWRHRRT
jgi:hypothetical protein